MSGLRLESRSIDRGFMLAVSNMIDGQNMPDDGKGKRNTYAVNLQAKSPSSASCSFCWFVLTTYPSLRGMTESDSATFRSHLEKEHGLRQEIQP